MPTPHSPELAIIIPVYNEEKLVGPVLAKWRAEMERLGVDYVMHVINDGATDNSQKSINAEAQRAPHGRILPHEQPNQGHGPAIRNGYTRGLGATWLFQIDSDDEMGVEAFEQFWNTRQKADFVVGERVRDGAPLARRLISAVSRLVIRVFYGAGVNDVNTPYRLMRSERFAPLIKALPQDTFAPNILISGFAAQQNMRIVNLPVRCVRRRENVKFVGARLLKGVALSFGQAILFRFNGMPKP